MLIWQWCMEMFTVNGKTWGRAGKQRGGGKSRCLYQVLFNKRKLPKFTWINEESSYITFSWQCGSCCLLCMISPKECNYYLNWQCWACMVGSCSALVQTAYRARSPRPSKLQPPRKVPMMGVQQIPTRSNTHAQAANAIARSFFHLSVNKL